MLSLCLTIVPGAAPVRAVSPAGGAAALSAQKLQEDRRSYLDSMQSTHGTSSGRAIVNPEASDGDMFAGVRVPPEVLSGLKNATTLDVIITIPGAPSVAQYAARHGTSISHLTAGDAAPVIAAERGAQEQTIHAIAAAGIGLSRLERTSILVNRITGTVAKSQFAGLVQVVGAANVHIARIYTINDAASNELIGSGPSGVWTDPGVDGTGMYVGVVDTGVDYTHPDLGGTPSSTVPTSKVVAAYDFGDNDSDPMDSNSHGTHVSGIIAADGANLKGVAPKAKLVVAKIVQGNTGSASSIDIMRAFEYMADPLNLDLGVEGTHPPVASINMSFGSIAGWADASDPEQMAIQACIDNGIVVSLSAGNSAGSYDGTGEYPWYPDMGTVGSPSLTPDAISVASSENSWFYGPAVTEATAAAEYVYIVGSTSPNPVTSLGDNAGAGYAYVYCGLGRVPADGAGYPDDFAGLTLTGKIALIDRGTTNFSMKINNAVARGAVGVVIANNGSGLVPMDTTGTTLTSVSVSKAGGTSLKLKAATPVGDGTGRLKFLGHFGDTPNPAVDTISSFSSWGPGPDFSFKPDLTAPGGNIFSTVPVAMGSYESMSGTSMAAPQVAAVAALVKEQHPDWTPAMVKIGLMNTAKPLTDPASGKYYSPHRQGAGRINVADALHTNVTVARDNGLPYVNLGSLVDYATVPTMFTLQLRNTGASAVSYVPNVTTQSVKEDGSAQAVSGVVVTTIPSGSITVPAGGTASLVVTLNLSGAVLPAGCFPYIEGFVSLVPTSGVALHVPYTGFMGSWNDFDKSSPAYNPILDPEASDIDHNFSQVLTDDGLGLTWPFGASMVGNDLSHNYLGQDFAGNLDMSHIGWNPAVTGQDNLLASMYVLRNAANVTIDVKDSTGSLVKQIDSYNDLWKGNYATYGLDGSWWYQNLDTGAMWWWDGKLSGGGNAPDGVYHLTYTATPFKMFNSAYADAPQVIDFPVILDTVDPVAAVTSVEAGAPGNWKVNFNGSDAGSGLWGYAVYYGDPTTDPTTWAHTMVDPTATSYEIPAGDGFSVVAYDFAGNLTTAPQIVTPAMYQITPSAGVGGTISPSTVQDVLYGNSTTFTMTPNTGYQIADVLVDSSSVGAVSTYTFSNVVANHIIAASFSATPVVIPGDIDGDGSVTMLDALLAARAAVGITTLTGSAFQAADVDHDGIISMLDVLLIARIAVGIS